jgi:hypothetical protein
MGVLWSSFEWLDNRDLCVISSAGGCMLASFPLLFYFPFLVDDLNCMRGESSMGVSRKKK